MSMEAGLPCTPATSAFSAADTKPHTTQQGREQQLGGPISGVPASADKKGTRDGDIVTLRVNDIRKLQTWCEGDDKDNNFSCMERRRCCVWKPHAVTASFGSACYEKSVTAILID
ncbi:hypothetical protein TREES_T100009338 [Tupaia chinensis]|uniref:Uncharacterized protein n=1 Tax=Tupaia chinensis TaxID=246437 RepID=L9JJB1_TUPCH|nr:hypothetical protein TREES_T100009338 [Tupaia chinensis]